MISFEQQYYENEAFWRPETFSDADRHRIGHVLSAIDKNVSSLIDVGCGGGEFCHLAQESLPQLTRVVGVDRSQAALKYVRTEKALADIAELPFADREFDAAVSLEVLEHLPISIFDKAVEELARVADRQVLVTVPNSERLSRNAAQCPACKTRFNRTLHMRSFDATAMRRLFEDTGFRCRAVTALTMPRLLGVGLFMSLYLRLTGGLRAMRHSVCPLCGYVDDANRQRVWRPAGEGSPRAKIKRYWPRVQQKRWLLGVYERQ